MKWNEFLASLPYSDLEIQNLTGIPRQTIHKIRTGETEIPQKDTIRRLEAGLNIKIDDTDPESIKYILKEEGTLKSKMRENNNIYFFPLYSQIQSGDRMTVNETSLVYYESPNDSCYVLKVSSLIDIQGMENTISLGDECLVDQEIIPKDGDVVALILSNGEQYIRRYKKIPGYTSIMFHSDYMKYQPLFKEPEEIKSVQRIVRVQKIV